MVACCSAEGLSEAANLSELLAYSIMIAYNFRLGLPWTPSLLCCSTPGDSKWRRVCVQHVRRDRGLLAAGHCPGISDRPLQVRLRQLAA